MPGTLYVPPAAVTGELQHFWIEPNGNRHNLSRAVSPRLFVSRGAQGLGFSGAEPVMDKLPFAAGEIPRYIRTPARRIELPLHIEEDTMADLMTQVDEIRKWFSTGDERRLTPGTLEVIRHDDTVRRSVCYYAGGLEGDLNEGAPWWTRYVVSLVAPDPYPFAKDQEVVIYTTDNMGFVPTVKPVLINDGEIDAYPVWTIRGPITGPKIYGTYEVIWMDVGGYALAAGEYVTIDTRPPHLRTNQAVLDSDGVNRYDKLTASSGLFWLTSGENRFILDGTGTSADTRFEVRYYPRYRGFLR